MSTNNFLWTVTDSEGNLLAFQERGLEPEIVDKEKAIERCNKMIIDAINNPDPKFDFLLTMQKIAEVVFTYHKIIGKAERPKSSIIMPGDKEY